MAKKKRDKSKRPNEKVADKQGEGRRFVSLILGAVAATLLALFGYYMMPLPEANLDVDETLPYAHLPPELAARVRAAELPEEQQKHIWDVEHMTFELETEFGKPLMAAIADDDRGKFASYLREDFEGSLPTSANEETIVHPPITERKRASAKSRASKKDFVDDTFEWLAEFDEIERARLRVLHLNQGDVDKSHWHAELLLTFHGANSSQQQMVSESHHLVDFQITSAKKIGKEPIVGKWSAVDESRRVCTKSLFREVTKEYGLNETPLMDNWAHEKKWSVQYWKQVAVEDFDNDGFLDIAAASNYGFPVLLRSIEGKRFEDVTAKMQLKRWQVDLRHLMNLAVWIDYDDDGYVDLFLGNRLYHNDQGAAFTDVTEQSGITIGNGPMGGVVADYDCDGLLDLYVLYQESADHTKSYAPWVGDDSSGGENQLWRNEGNGVFRNVTEEANAGAGRRHSFAATWHFYDDDRYPDLYVANDFGKNVHLRNRGDGTFEDISEKSGMADFATSMGVTSGDVNNDGRPDFYVANMYSKMGRRIIAHVGKDDYPDGVYEQIQGSCAGNRLYVAGDDGGHEDISDRCGVNGVGWAYAPNMVDLDGDGWLDLYAATGFMSFDRELPDG